MPERIVFTPNEVAAMLGLSRSTIYRRLKNGTIPVVQIGDGRKLIPRKLFLQMFGEGPEVRR